MSRNIPIVEANCTDRLPHHNKWRTYVFALNLKRNELLFKRSMLCVRFTFQVIPRLVHWNLCFTVPAWRNQQVIALCVRFMPDLSPIYGPLLSPSYWCIGKSRLRIKLSSTRWTTFLGSFMVRLFIYSSNDYIWITGNRILVTLDVKISE